MDILNEVFAKFNSVYNKNISERMMIVDITFNIKYDDIPSYESCINITNLFPKRDRIEIELRNSFEDSIYIKGLREVNEEQFKSFINESDSDEPIEIKIRIKKTVENNTISIYCFDSFCNEIMQPNVLDIIEIFSGVLKENNNLIFEMFDSDKPFSTESMQFRSASRITTTMEFNRINKLEVCKNNSYFFNVNEYELLPEDFHMVTSFQNNPFEEVFEKIETIFSLAYIANTASINNETLNIQICGQKNVNSSYELFPNLTIINNKEFYKIYKWIYTDGNPIDKAIIGRNMISMHCRYMDLLQLDDKTFASISSNYALYQKNNVEKYLELKNQLSEYIMVLSKQIGDIIIELVQRVKNNLIAFFTFIISAIFANLASSAQLDNIFTNQVIAIINIILLGSTIYMGISIYEVNMMIKNLDNGYNELKNKYIGLLDNIDIIEIFGNDEFKKQSIKKTRRNRNIIVGIWIAMILIIAIVTNSYNKSTHNMDEVKVSNHQTTSSTLQIKE